MSMHVAAVLERQSIHFSSLPLPVIIKDSKANAFDAALLLRYLMDLQIYSTNKQTLTILIVVVVVVFNSSDL